MVRCLLNKSYFWHPISAQSMTCPPKSLILYLATHTPNKLKTLSPNCFCVTHRESLKLRQLLGQIHLFVDRQDLFSRIWFLLHTRSQRVYIYLHVSSHLARGLIFLRFLAPAELFFPIVCTLGELLYVCFFATASSRWAIERVTSRLGWLAKGFDKEFDVL